jgi:hypothetical protein
MEREELLKARALQFLLQDRYNDRVRTTIQRTQFGANICAVQAQGQITRAKESTDIFCGSSEGN